MTLQVVPDVSGDRGGGPAGGRSPLHSIGPALRGLLAGSPGRLRVIGAATIAATLLLAVVGTLAMQARSSALQTARGDAEQLVRVQALRTALVQADADATNAYLTGGVEPPALRAQYRANLTRAATLVAEAARANSADAPTLAQVNDVIVGYSGLIESARANNRQNLQVGTAYLSQASTQLRTQGLSALTRVATANQERVDAAYDASRNAAYQFWAVAVVWLLVLLAAQYRLAQRTRRYLNLPLAGATVVLLLVIAICGLGMAQAQSRAQQARSGDLAEAIALSQARVSAFDAKSTESLTLINRGSGSASDPAADEIAAAQGGLADAGTGRLGLDGWVAVHQQIRDLDNGGAWEKASARAVGTGPQDSNATFAAFDTASQKALDTAVRGATGDLRDAADSVALRSWLLGVLGLLGAAAAWWGISVRLGEYR